MKKAEIFGLASTVTFRITVTADQINTFAELTGDFSPNHMDEAFMKNTVYGKRIAHGALLVGYMSTASSMIIDKYIFPDNNATPVSLGYDRIRFIKPVYIDDTITVTYTVVQYDAELLRSSSTIEITNQQDELVAIASHILKWVPNT